MTDIPRPFPSATYGPSSHPTQLQSPSDAPHAVPSSPDLSGTAQSIAVNVFRKPLVVDTARPPDPHPPVSQDVRTSTDANVVPLSVSMSSLSLHPKNDNSSVASLTLELTGDENDGGQADMGDGSPLTFAMGDPDGENWVVEFNDTDLSERSPLIFARLDFDDDDENLGRAFYRRVSWPLTVSMASSVDVSNIDDDERRGKLSPKALRRHSRSLDSVNLSDLPISGDSGPPIGLLVQANPDTLGSPINSRRDNADRTLPSKELDIQYILSAQSDSLDSRRSSAALSYVQLPPKMHEPGYLFSLRRKLTGSARIPITDSADNEDTFTRVLEEWDADYDVRKDYWTIKRQDDITHDSIRGSSRGKTKSKDKISGNKGMSPGMEEIWTCGFMGMFKVERISYPADPAKPPHQRLNLSRTPDPKYDSSLQGGPDMVIHKHSRTTAFTIIRAHSFAKNERLGTGVLLAPCKVQERYTTTKNTAKLATHGLLDDSDPDVNGKRGATNESQQATTGSEFSSEFISFNGNSDHIPLSLRFTFESSGTAEAGTSSRFTSIAAPSSQIQTDISFESVSDGETIRSLHAYARPPLHRRNSSDLTPFYHHLAKADSLPSSFFRRWLRPPPRPLPSSHGVGPSVDFKVPWLTMTQRSKPDDADRSIHKLNDSFIAAGLAPILAKPVVKSRRYASKIRRNSGILGHLSEDTLYMILPLWPAESDGGKKRLRTQNPKLEDRCYLLVYYVPFEFTEMDKPKKWKKRPSASSDSGKWPEDRDILWSEFRVCACRVNYAELRGSGVRLPNEGLVVNGMDGATIGCEKLACGINDPHGLVIGMYHGKERKVEFVPEGILKLCLCLDQVRSVEARETSKEAELSPLGRAVVEMVWAGCMALSSFGSA